MSPSDPAPPSALEVHPPGRASPAADSSPDSLSRCLADSLTARDRELLAALDRGDPIDLIEYADWIRRPEIQHLLSVRDQLHADQERARERRNRDFADTETRAAVAILNDTILEADKLRKAEGTATTDQLKALNTRRIAASNILRLCNHHRARAATLRHGTAPSPLLGGSVTAGSAAVPLGVRRGGTRGAPSSTRPTTPPRPATSDPTQDSGPGTQDSSSPRSPCSTIPGLQDTIIGFLRAAGSGLEATLPWLARHRRLAAGDEALLEEFGRIPALTSATTAQFGPALYQDDLDSAVQHLTLTHAGGETPVLIHAVLQRSPIGDTTWAIAALADQPDTS